MRQLSMQEVQQVELDLLNQFKQLCNKNNLYYTLCGGTLLGAIRHKGFIPWDDDIDVLMPRMDYDRLLNMDNIDTSTLSEGVEIISWKSGNFNYPFIKLVNRNTKIDNQYFDEKYKDDNIWIDIFPIDGNPEDKAATEKVYNKSLAYRKWLRIYTAKAGEGKNLFKRVFKPFLIWIVRRFSIYKLCEKVDNLAKTYDFYESKWIGGILWGYDSREKIDRQAYMTPVDVEFEGGIFNAPSNYDEYLTNLYGDYMQLPPEDKRVTHEMKAYIIEEH